MAKLVLKSEVAAAPDLLWQTIRGFSSIKDWNPLVQMIDSQGETVGATRTLNFQGAGRFTERLEELDDGARLYTYSIVESPLPLSNCTVQVRVQDNGDGTSTVEWSSDFESEPNQELAAVKTFQQMYQEALDNLQSFMPTARKKG